MPSYNDEGIVLRRIEYAEVDRILTILTRDHGKLGVIARGVRKPSSKLASHTDLFACSRLQLATGRGELDVLTQAQTVTPAPRSTTPVRVGWAAFCAELADRVLEDRHRDVEMYELVVAAIHGCLDGARDPRAAVAWFARRMIDRLGYAPQLDGCAGCGGTVGDEGVAFSAISGGLVCRTCRRADPSAIDCSLRTIKVLRTIAAGEAALYARLRLDREILETLEAIVEHELAQHLERRLRSFAVVRSLEQSAR